MRFGFLLKSEDLYPSVRCKELLVDAAIDDLADFAVKHGVTYAQLKDFNTWLRGRSLSNGSRRTYRLLIPEKEDMCYDPKQTTAYRKEWVID